MNRQLLGVYQRLPPALQSVTASAHGAYLRSWRYGPGTHQAVDEALARERWSSGEWRQYQGERLAAILARAAESVPFYRQQWETRRRQGDCASPAMLANWPILEKADVRAQARALVADDCRPRTMFHEQTSGTTGTPLDLWRSRATVRAWYALSEARWREWYGVSTSDRWGILGGQLVASVARHHPPFWVWNQPLHQLYLSCYHLSAANLPHYLDALRTFRIRYLVGYTSALYALADGALRIGDTGHELAVVIANAEPVFEFQRDAIVRAFGCPLRETYGSAEKVIAAGECESGRLHLWPEVGVVEVMDGGAALPAGRCGDLVCTSLLDSDMPLIRYRTGDRGSIGDDGPCACGRTLPALASIEGRADDTVVTPDGRRVGRLDPVFKAGLPIREAQIVQDAPDHIRVRYVPDAGFTAASSRQIVRRLRDRLGDMRVTLEPVDAIPRGANGKFRAVVSSIHV
jgi:phenylacetate-CoA ligase